MDKLVELGYVNLTDYFVDGTKLEANANKYSYVWRKNTERYKQQVQEKIKALYRQIEALNLDEEKIYKGKDLAELGEDVEVTSRKARELKEVLECRLKQMDSTNEKKELKKGLKKLDEDYLPCLEEYEKQEELLGGRNGYSKTDPDATFMRMKDDPMKNRLLRAGYNIHVGTNKQFILHYSIHPNSTDSPTLILHIEGFKERYGRYPTNAVIGDAGYGSEENYKYLDHAGIRGYVKYNYFYREQSREYKKNPFHAEHMKYKEEQDVYECPQGRELKYVFSKFRYSDQGFCKTIRVYECEECKGCPVRSSCHGSKYNRRIEVNRRLNYYLNRVRVLLESEQGVSYRKKRSIEPESVFGQIKQNFGFRRFSLRGKEKVQLEFVFFALAHNLMKWWRKGGLNPKRNSNIQSALSTIHWFVYSFAQKFEKYLCFELEY